MLFPRSQNSDCGREHTGRQRWKVLMLISKLVENRAARYIACDCHAHLISKAGSVIINKSSSPDFKWSGV